MIWRGTEVEKLTDDALIEAQMLMWASLDFYNKRQADPKYKERFNNQNLPEINPHFVSLKKALEDEMKKRNLVITGTV